MKTLVFLSALLLSVAAFGQKRQAPTPRLLLSWNLLPAVYKTADVGLEYRLRPQVSVLLRGGHTFEQNKNDDVHQLKLKGQLSGSFLSPALRFYTPNAFSRFGFYAETHLLASGFRASRQITQCGVVGCFEQPPVEQRGHALGGGVGLGLNGTSKRLALEVGLRYTYLSRQNHLYAYTPGAGQAAGGQQAAQTYTLQGVAALKYALR